MSKRRTERLRFGVFIAGEEIFGKRSSLTDVAMLLKNIPRAHATAWISSLCNLYEPGEIASIFTVDRKASESLLSPDLRRRVAALALKGTVRLAFHRPQMLLGLQLVQRMCIENPVPHGRRSPTAELWNIGEALIRISDFLNPATVNPDWKATAALLLPLYFEANPPGTLLALRRTYRMLSDALWEKDSRLASAAARFGSAMGFSPREYMLVVLGLVTKAMGRRELNTDTSLRMGQVFAQARDKEKIQRVVAYLSTPFEDLPSRVEEPARVVQQRLSEPFRSRPLIKLEGDRFWVADLSYLNERMLSGVFWTLMDHSSASERDKLIPAWGDLFESYINARLGPVLGSRYFASPTDKNGDQITDAAVIEKPAVVLIECKAALMKDSAKYSLSFDPVMKELKKFLKDGQLAKAAIRLLRDRRDLTGNMRPRFFPVILSLDHSVAAPFLARAMDEELRTSDLPARSDAVFERLSVLTADDAENLIPFLEAGGKLKNILRESHEGDPTASNTFHNHLAGRQLERPPLEVFTEPFDAAREFWLAQGGDDLFASI